MTVNRCTIRGNVGAGIDGYYSAGGGIDNGGVLTVNSSTISENGRGQLRLRRRYLQQRDANHQQQLPSTAIAREVMAIALAAASRMTAARWCSTTAPSAEIQAASRMGVTTGAASTMAAVSGRSRPIQHDNAPEHYCCEQCSRRKLQRNYDLDGIQPQQRQNL